MLTATNLTRRFDGRVAVENASLALEAGQVFALLGPNGAGKTTTLRMLAGLIAPSSGRVVIQGQEVTRATSNHIRHHIGFLTEAPGLWDRLTVRQNLAVYARLHGLTDAGRIVDETLELFGIGSRASQLAALLSKGLKQRVALARTLIHKPAVVLLDEPTSGLDPESARGVRELILGLRNEGRAILLSTHNLDEVERIADRVAILRTRMIAVDTPAALRDRVFGRRLRIRLAQDPAGFITAAGGDGVNSVTSLDRSIMIEVDDPGRRAPDVVRRLVLAGADILSVAADEPSLEDVYLRLLEDSRTP